MNDIIVFVDADGVCVDFELGIENRGFVLDRTIKHEINRSGSDNPLKRAMYENIKGTSFYYDCPILEGALELWARIVQYDPIILTASPKFGSDENDFHTNPFWCGAAYNKRRWFEEKFLPIVYHHNGLTPRLHERISLKDENFICTTSARKTEFMHRRKGKHQILFDDREANCFSWAKEGGFAILYGTADDAIQALDWYELNGDASRDEFLPNGGGMVWGLDHANVFGPKVTFVQPDGIFYPFAV